MYRFPKERQEEETKERKVGSNNSEEVASVINVEINESESRPVESTFMGCRGSEISGESDRMLNVRPKQPGKVKDANRLKSQMVPGDVEASGNCCKEQRYQASESQQKGSQKEAKQASGVAMKGEPPNPVLGVDGAFFGDMK